ncbi:MAG TPA: hypothetical protein VNA20_14635 [Frankiaceae bacterium]|nr:hypothetical protein [Frankiaceae bacterium]
MTDPAPPPADPYAGLPRLRPGEGDVGWGGEAYGFGPTYDVAYGPRPGGWDGGWGTGGTGTGYPAPGYPPYGPPRRRGRRAVALTLGIASNVALVLVALLFGFGFATFFAGGFALFILAIYVWWGAIALAVTSIAVGLLSRGPGVGSRLASTIPAWLTVLVFTAFGGGGDSPPAYDYQTMPPTTVRELPADTPPDEVAHHAEFVLAGRPQDVCPLLAAAARGPRCPEAPAFIGPHRRDDGTFRTLWVRGDQALVVSEEPFPDGPKKRVRLVREATGWQLLDLPGLSDECVDTSKEPFRCPVRRYGDG